jgi:uncharacterized iron-regulated membrane protein
VSRLALRFGARAVPLRTLIFWPHLAAGLVAGLVILLMSVTGVLLTYERQLIAWSDAQFRSSPPQAGAERLPIETLLARLREARPDLAPVSITVRSEPDAPVMLTVTQRVLYADAYTGALLGEGTQTVRRAMSELRAWHRWIAVEGEGRPIARAITGWANVIFLCIVLSGMYLWLPRKWSWAQVKAVALFNTGARGKARDFNWHNVFGIWSAIPLFIVVMSAVPISFPWGTALVYRAVGDAPPAPPARAGGPPVQQRARREPPPPPPLTGLDALWARAAQREPDWRTINMRVPTSPDAPVVFAIDRGEGGQPQYRSTLTLARATGEVVTYEAFSDLSPGRRVRNVMRFAHTGEVFGIPGQTVAGLVTFGGAVLVWTGIALALRRFRAWIRRRRAREDPAPAAVRNPAA